MTRQLSNSTRSIRRRQDYALLTEEQKEKERERKREWRRLNPQYEQKRERKPYASMTEQQKEGYRAAGRRYYSRNKTPHALLSEGRKAQMRAAQKRYRQEHPDRIRESRPPYDPAKRRSYDSLREEQKARGRAKSRQWRLSNPERSRAIGRSWVANLTDGYITLRLGFNKKSDVPRVLLEAKRAQMELTRLTRKKA